MTARTVTRRTAGVLLAAAVTLAVGGLSQLPYEAEAADHAVVRLAWRVRGVRVEECRRLTDEELRRLPVHMRQAQVCEGRLLPHELTVDLDGRRVVAELVRAAGAREDRPIYVFRELSVSPGGHDLALAFVRQGRRADDTTAVVTPDTLTLATHLTLAPKEVALVTYDADARQLTVRRYGR